MSSSIMGFLASLSLAISASATESPPTAVPRFELAPCPATVEAGERIECGFLVVPENRQKTDSRSIQLPVMRLRSRAAKPAKDPLFFMPGGPGVSAVARLRSGKKNPVLDERDLIVLEPRGGKMARPALECPDINALKGDIAAGRLRGAKAQEALTKAAGRCRATLTAAGVDLDGYTTAATADDIEDLRKALGYETWNLQGLSYSTRLMLTVLRRHPAGVRSVILDSVLPPEVNFDEVAAVNLLRSLDLVFDGCAIDRECSAAHPDLRQRFARLIATAERKPLPLVLKESVTEGRPVEVRGAQVVEALYTALHDPESIPLLPRIISRAAAGDYSELTSWVERSQGASTMSWGLRLSVWCSEEVPFEDPKHIAAQHSPAMGLGGVDEGTASVETCRVWNVAPVPAEENTPVKSDVPTLIFAGEFDPDTPPDWGRQLLESMPQARYVELRGYSHGASFNRCGGEVTLAFLRDPQGPLPLDCVLKLRGADFGRSATAP
ncbi:alpha/beta fold hydrolase [Myxococcus qinghaiensis]|uniref:alpha/beta fold hydrolase n=1 Tax=Myxococcus qinghaiensis TaxID=2906758 RepID=UPI0020A73F3C|nr:alpha/beta fold hydrolase [Myxococcus qinghaiensis]MCP3168114.1 alpha/beta hydrolase [Myxococcus qinghaiensis]